MASNPDGFDRQVVERTLCQIADIQAAKVVTGVGDRIDELHVLAVAGKGPKQLARDIETTLKAKFGLNVDHRKISIAQIAVDTLPAKPSEPSDANGGVRFADLSMLPRPILEGIQARTGTDEDIVTVRLRMGGSVYEGSSRGRMALEGRLRLVARATLEAIKSALNSDWLFYLEDAAVVRLGGCSVAVSCFKIGLKDSQETFSGSATVSGSEDEACVRSVLDGVNRRLAALTSS